jgi:hypothetical protein
LVRAFSRTLEDFCSSRYTDDFDDEVVKEVVKNDDIKSENSYDEKQWEERNLVDNEQRIQRFNEYYKKIDKLVDLETIRPSPIKDPIVSYLKEV